MRLLLDTNALLWLLGITAEESRLGPEAARLISEAESVSVSAISIFEMQIKTTGNPALMNYQEARSK